MSKEIKLIDPDSQTEKIIQRQIEFSTASINNTYIHIQAGSTAKEVGRVILISQLPTVKITTFKLKGIRIEVSLSDNRTPKTYQDIIDTIVPFEKCLLVSKSMPQNFYMANNNDRIYVPEDYYYLKVYSEFFVMSEIDDILIRTPNTYEKNITSGDITGGIYLKYHNINKHILIPDTSNYVYDYHRITGLIEI